MTALPPTHFHVCEGCFHVWHHERRDGLTPEERAAYHRCPRCGAGPYRFGYTTRRDTSAVVRHLRSDEPDAAVFSDPPRQNSS